MLGYANALRNVARLALAAKIHLFKEQQHPRGKAGRFARTRHKTIKKIDDEGIKSEINKAKNFIISNPGRSPEDYVPAIRNVLHGVAYLMGFPPNFSNYSIVTELPPNIDLNGRRLVYAGSCNLTTGHVKVYASKIHVLDSIDGTIAHELMHHKFESVMKAYKKEKQGLDIRHIHADGTLKPEYRKRFPFYDALKGKMGMGALSKDDGITPYSREYWDIYNKGGTFGSKPLTATATVHETLAEMAKLDLEGSLDKLIWYKVSKSWKPLYQAVNKLFDEHLAET